MGTLVLFAKWLSAPRFNIPIKILALDFNIGHSISNFSLADLSGRLFLSGTHDYNEELDPLIVAVMGRYRGMEKK